MSEHTIPVPISKQEQFLLDHFWKRVQKTESCWIWTGCTVRGYGHFCYNGKQWQTHRLVWTLANGPIPDGLSVLHDCPGGDNPSCCNPAHLWLGTQTDNHADMVAKGRIARGERNQGAKLVAADVLEMRRAHAAGEASAVTLAERFCITKVQARNIIAHRNWKHLP